MSKIVPNKPDGWESLVDNSRSKDTSSYPGGLDFRPGSDLHNKIVNLVRDCAFESHQEMSKRHPSWRKIDHAIETYFPADTAEQTTAIEHETKPGPMIVPILSVVLDVYMSYAMSSSLMPPVFRYEGQGPEDTIKTILLEYVNQFQSQKMKHQLNLYVMYRDSFLYGFGACGINWRRDVRYRDMTLLEKLRSLMAGNMNLHTEVVDGIDFEGSELTNIDPYDILIDPNCPIHEMHKAEWFGQRFTTTYHSLLSESRNDPSLFNVEALKDLKNTYSALNAIGRREERRDTYATTTTNSTTVEGYRIIKRVIPSDLGLAPRSYPELWLFEVVGDQLLIRAKRLQDRHRMIPAGVIVPDMDGHNLNPKSIIEKVYPLSKAISFLVSQMIANQEKIGNDLLIWDPAILNSKDMMAPGGARMVRVNPEWAGRPGAIENAFKQMNMFDVTRNNIASAMSLIEFVQQFTGAAPSMQGIIQPGGERRTGLEVSTTHTAAMSRLATKAQLASWQGLSDLAYMAAHNTIQYMSQPVWMKVVGQYQQQLASIYGNADFLRVGPQDLADVNFDVVPQVPHTGNVQALMQILQMLMSNPETASTIDFDRYVRNIAREAGIRNIEDFKRKPSEAGVVLASPQQIAEQEQAGNIVSDPAMRVF